MTRMFPRTFFAIALIAVLLAAAAPAVQARPLAKPARSVQTAGGDLLSAAWSWLGRLFTIEPAIAQKSKSDPTTTTGTGGLGARDTGSCIDPNGGCTFGGGGN